ncbi:2-dehydro-3-deoxygluconokinase [Micromonospora viridifaciens]|uniref:2-dehydro-3-deoxygluconokinase n=1 Tax=Micromonospora viridifaciens TaxID=1881 RepID=A0A1C4WT03_MICVI|nr:sugar kinase [Micromonospora viridifaciens]SCE99283.1 2-dehydro-3-deoxygluconokinase [Micromonospora viridifaciens]
MSIDVITLGESLGLLSPVEAAPILRQPFLRLGFGGAESNVAIGLARLGRTAHWVGRLGSDDIGTMIARELRAENVRTSIIIDSAPTGLMLKTHSPAGRVQVSYYRTGSAGSRLRPSDVDERLVASARVLHVTGITLALGASPAATVREAVEVARANRVAVSFDLNFRSALWSPDEAVPVLRDLAKAADILFATDAEAELLVDEREPEAQARAIARLGPRQVVVKRGADGSLACIDDVIYRQDPVPVTAVDPVGAGDAFAAGYLSQVVSGGSARQRLDAGGVGGALAVTSRGDWEGLPHAADIADLRHVGEVQR